MKAVRVQKGDAEIGGCLEVLGLGLEHVDGTVSDHAPVESFLRDGAELFDHVRQFGVFGFVARVFACGEFVRKGAADFGNQIVGHGSALLRPAGTPGACGKRRKTCGKN